MRLPTATVEWLRSMATVTGKSVTTIVAELLERSIDAYEIAAMASDPTFNQPLVNPAQTWAAILGDDEDWTDYLPADLRPGTAA